jgi:hypothetical protein
VEIAARQILFNGCSADGEAMEFHGKKMRIADLRQGFFL